MNQPYEYSAYFADEQDARRAAEELQSQGCDVELRSQAHGETFWDAIKHFFSGEPHERYGAGTMLIVHRGDPRIVQEVVPQYNGQVNEPPGTLPQTVTTPTTMASTSAPPTDVPPTTTVGETGASPAVDVEEYERERMRTGGGISGLGGNSSGLGGGVTSEGEPPLD